MYFYKILPLWYQPVTPSIELTIDPGARKEGQNCYLYHIILLTVRAPQSICESPFKPTQSQMSLVVPGIVLKIKFAIKCYETVLYTCNI